MRVSSWGMDAVVPYLSYPDAPEAIAWLEGLGFEVTSRQDGPDGRVVHCEVSLGDAVVMVASDDEDYSVPPLRGHSTGVGAYIVTTEVDGMFARALAGGAQTVIEPEQTAWGSRRARVLDPFGREWTFGSYRPGNAGGSG